MIAVIREAKQVVEHRFGGYEYVRANHILARRRFLSLVNWLSDEQKHKLGKGLGIKDFSSMTLIEQYQQLSCCTSNIFLGPNIVETTNPSLDPIYLQVEGKHTGTDIKLLDIRALLYEKIDRVMWHDGKRVYNEKGFNIIYKCFVAAEEFNLLAIRLDS